MIKFRWQRIVGVLGATGIAGAGLYFASHRVEQSAVQAMLGKQATAAETSLFVRSNSGRLDSVRVPLTSRPKSDLGQPVLTADRLWFTYDLGAFLKKRFVFPHVVIEGAELRVVAPASPGEPNRATPPWIDSMQRITREMKSREFLDQTAVMREMATITNRWNESFTEKHRLATELQTNAKQLQQELQSIDNRLRQFNRLDQGIAQLNSWGQEFDKLLVEINFSDGVLQADRRSLRATLLKDKEQIDSLGSAFSAPKADDFAAQLIQGSIRKLWNRHVDQFEHVALMLRQPFQPSSESRGEVIEQSAVGLPHMAVYEAKIEGNTIGQTSTEPFVSTAQFQLAATPIRKASSQESSEPTSTAEVRVASYRLAAGDPASPCILEGELHRQGSSIDSLTIKMKAPQFASAECSESEGKIDGTFEVDLAEWLGDHKAFLESVRTCDSHTDQAMMVSMVQEAMRLSDDIPSHVRIRVTGTWQNPTFEMNDETWNWLAEALRDQANDRIRVCYQEAAQELDRSVQSGLDELNRLVATSRNEAQQHIQRLRSELDRMRFEIERMKESGEVNFVRVPTSTTTR